MFVFQLQDFYHFFLLFARISVALSILPGFSETTVTPRIRVFLAVFFCLILQPLIPAEGAKNMTAMTIGIAIAGEMVIGFALGMVGKILLMILDLIGGILSFEMGLSSAVVFNPQIASQTPVVTSFLTMAGITLIFLTDLHYLMIQSLVESYTVFPINFSFVPTIFNDFSKMFVKAIQKFFYLGVQLSIPFLIAGTILQVLMGLFNRVMPQLQIFFVGLPLQVLGGILLMLLMLVTLMNAFQVTFQSGMKDIFGFG